jgi:hypothetical protein
MNGEADLRVLLPEKVNARTRLGPFASGRDALKFVAYAAVGGLLAVTLGPAWWLPFLAAGALVTIPHWNGQAPDQRLARYVRWRFRRRMSSPARITQAQPPRATERVAQVAPGVCAAVVVACGVPTSFLPLEDRRSLFVEYRTLLGAVGPGALFTMGVEPLPTRPFVPPPDKPSSDSSEQLARRGYAEMVRLLCRRRFRRQVRWVLWGDSSSAGRRDLEQRAERLHEALNRLGALATEAAGKELGRYLRALGWAEAMAGP